MHWYVLYTASRAEKKVEKQLIADGIEAYLPLHLSPRKWSDRVKMVEVPLFSSYIFVRTTDELLRTLLRYSGVARIVFHNGHPAVVRQQEIEAIRRFLEEAKGKECEFTVNEEVHIASGPMKDVKGKVKRVAKNQLILYLEQIGITVRINTGNVLKA